MFAWIKFILSGLLLLLLWPIAGLSDFTMNHFSGPFRLKWLHVILALLMRRTYRGMRVQLLLWDATDPQPFYPAAVDKLYRAELAYLR